MALEQGHQGNEADLEKENPIIRPRIDVRSEDSEDDEAEIKSQQIEIINRVRNRAIDLRQVEAFEDFERQYSDCLVDGEHGATLIHEVLHVPADTEFEIFAPLLQAVFRIVPDLLEVKDEYGVTALHSAIRMGDGKIVKLLCEICPRPKEAIGCTGPDGGNCIHAAIRRGLPNEIVEFLIDEADEEILAMRDAYGNTPLHAAVEAPGERINVSRTVVVDKLLSKFGEAARSLNRRGFSPYQHHKEQLDRFLATEESALARSSRENSSPSRAEKPSDEQKSHGSNPLGSIPPAKQGSRRLVRIRPKRMILYPAAKEEQFVQSQRRDLYLRSVAEIQTALKVHCMRNFDREQVLSVLYGSNQPPELELDLSEMTSISRGTLTDMGAVLRFESVLRYVALPSTTAWKDDVSKNSPDSEIQGRGRWTYVPVFDWLLKHHAVRKILRVTVLDEPYPPHSDEAIEMALSKFDIEEWDWMRVNICSETISKVAPNVRRVHLYSDGNNAVLREWAAADGLAKLTKLKRVDITVTPGLEQQTRADENLRSCTDNLLRLRPDIMVTTFMVKSMADLEKLPVEDVKDAWVDGLRNFARVVKSISEGLHTTKNTRLVRVALIDDGVDIHSLGQSNIVSGMSCALRQDSESLISPWYISTKQHGTAMAELICEPLRSLRLYVAKIDGRGGRDGVLKAVTWALNIGVDIICLGFRFPQDFSFSHLLPDQSIREVFRKAYDAGIPIICEEGSFPGMLEIGTDIQKRGSEVLFPGRLHRDSNGRDILDPQSTAMALATALSAVIVYCIENFGGDAAKQRRSASMPHLLENFFKAYTRESVQPWDLFKKVFRAGDPEQTVTALNELTEHLVERYYLN